MSYFLKDFIEFFSELEKNNNREWFQQNKERYSYSVKIPFEIFVQELINLIRQHDDSISPNAKDSLFRIYRDVRFSSDKSPYKTFASAIISTSGRKDYTIPGFYIEFNASKILIYMGAYFLDSKQLYKVRISIKNNLTEFTEIINEKNFRRKFGQILGDKNKIIPKEFREISAIQPLIMNKQFYCNAQLDSKRIISSKLLETIADYYFISIKFKDFLIDAINQ